MNEFLVRLSAGVESRRRVVVLLRAVVPVVGAVLYLILWIVGEAGRVPQAPTVLLFLFWAVGIALVGVRPYFSLAVMAAIPVVLGAAGIALSVSAGAFESDFALSVTWPAWFAVPLVVGYAAATNRGRRIWFLAVGAGLVSAIVFAIVVFADGWLSWVDWVPGDAVRPFLELAFGLCAAVVVAWLIGLGLAALWRVQIVSERLETTEARLDETDLELKLAHDRGRISRDIHDSLAHSLAIIVAQAEGAEAIHELRPEAAPESLSNIATVARHALGEVRRLVERINDDEEDLSEHTSRIEHIPALVNDLRAAGVQSQLRVLGDLAPLSLSKQIAVYRIVQESLTNALKHGGRGTMATVTLDAQGTGLAVLVVSTSSGAAPLVPGGGRGIGIAGMKERARLVGGWLTAVPSDEKTFVVTAFVPPDASTDAGNTPVAEASAEIIDAEPETGVLAIGAARG